MDAQNYYQVELSTLETKKIVIQAHIDGEYPNNLLPKFGI